MTEPKARAGIDGASTSAVVEPAAPQDLPVIAEQIRAFRLDGENLDAAQFVVIRDAGRVVAFGRIKPYGDGVFELGSVGVLPEERGKGLGETIVRELIRAFPVDEVYITTDLTAYFERLGFTRTDGAPPPLLAKIDKVCAQLRSGVVAMVLHRSR
jgi:N-acetylglutamate synthase-like GNAT family acetyltransferase